MARSMLDRFDIAYEDDDDWDPSYEDLLDSSIEESILDQSVYIAEDLGLSPSLLSKIKGMNNKPYSVIESNVGDDANVTTDSLAYGILTTCAATHISFIKLSDKDVGMSKYIANYAEGWMLTPPSAGSSFEAVNRFDKGRGLAFTLDPVKLKLLSAVRKQSSEEMDLESKLSHLAEIAAWTDRSWFTYDFHQMALILANCVFDFNDARSFPYLYKTEGGSGGMPPYGNTATAYSALHYYTRGRSKRAILGVMQESLAITAGRLSPKDSFFLRASHIANAGDREWAHYESAYRTMVEQGRMSRAEARDCLRTLQGSDLPDDLLSLGFEVTPDRFTTGSAIGHLREKGYLQTEVDVKLLQQKVEKERAVFGTKPLEDILLEQEESARLFKSQSWKLLTTLYEGSPTIKQQVDVRLGSVGTDYESFYDLASSYYRMRGDHNAQFSSFFYTDTIRVFKTKDVSTYFGERKPALAEDFAQSELIPRFRSIPVETRHERLARDEVESWLDSGDLNSILQKPLPTGIGTDDSRILNEIASTPVNNVTGHVTIIISNDSGLIRASAAILKTRPWGPNTTAVVSQLRNNDYTAICLQGVREAYDNHCQGIKGPSRIHRVPYYNYILKQEWLLPETVVTGIRDMVPGNWRKAVECRLYYDVPNLERGLERTRYRSDTNTVTVLSGGALARHTVDSMPKSKSWAEIPMSIISQWDDFSVARKRVLHAKWVKIKPHAFVARPEYVASNRRVNLWLETALLNH